MLPRAIQLSVFLIPSVKKVPVEPDSSNFEPLSQLSQEHGLRSADYGSEQGGGARNGSWQSVGWCA